MCEIFIFKLFLVIFWYSKSVSALFYLRDYSGEYFKGGVFISEMFLKHIQIHFQDDNKVFWPSETNINDFILMDIIKYKNTL